MIVLIKEKMIYLLDYPSSGQYFPYVDKSATWGSTGPPVSSDHFQAVVVVVGRFVELKSPVTCNKCPPLVDHYST